MSKKWLENFTISRTYLSISLFWSIFHDLILFALFRLKSEYGKNMRKGHLNHIAIFWSCKMISKNGTQLIFPEYLRNRFQYERTDFNFCAIKIGDNLPQIVEQCLVFCFSGWFVPYFLVWVETCLNNLYSILPLSTLSHHSNGQLLNLTLLEEWSKPLQRV